MNALAMAADVAVYDILSVADHTLGKH